MKVTPQVAALDGMTPMGVGHPKRHWLHARGAQHYVYRNLHRQCWSVRLRGKVIAHESEVWVWHAQFKVSEPGRQRVLRERRKNVHAFVCGRAAVPPLPVSLLDMGDPLRVKYSPYKSVSFYTPDDFPRRQVQRAKLVCLRADGTVLAWGVE
jgi:hypothetical protein